MNLQSFLDGNGLVAVAILIGLAFVAITVLFVVKTGKNTDQNPVPPLQNQDELSEDLKNFIDKIPPENVNDNGSQPVSTKNAPKFNPTRRRKFGIRNRMNDKTLHRVATAFIAGETTKSIAKREKVAEKAIKKFVVGNSYLHFVNSGKFTFPLKNRNGSGKMKKGSTKLYADWAFQEIKNAGNPLRPWQLAPLLKDRMLAAGYSNSSQKSLADSIGKAMHKDKRFIRNNSGFYDIRDDLK